MIGAGVMPDVMLARAAGLELGESGGVRGRLAAARPRCRASSPPATSPSTRASSTAARACAIEHWDVAFNQGKTAALNMLGREQPHDVVPYFFSDLSDWAALEYVGPPRLGPGGRPRLARRRRVHVFYLQGGRVAGALSVGRSDDLEHARRLLAAGTDVADRVDELADPSTDLASVVKVRAQARRKRADDRQ